MTQSNNDLFTIALSVFAFAVAIFITQDVLAQTPMKEMALPDGGKSPYELSPPKSYASLSYATIDKKSAPRASFGYQFTPLLGAELGVFETGYGKVDSTGHKEAVRGIDALMVVRPLSLLDYKPISYISPYLKVGGGFDSYSVKSNETGGFNMHSDKRRPAGIYGFGFDARITKDIDLNIDYLRREYFTQGAKAGNMVSAGLKVHY